MRLLFTGDLHIGRSSSRISPRVLHDALRASAAWERIVALAIEENVGVVCLSGDVADKENKFWEAVGPLEVGVKRLAEAGIVTVAVAGNHDYDVLARLADQLPPEQFRLLGRGGKWQRYVVKRNGEPVLHIDGWSFPSERVHKSPLLDYDLADDCSTPILGLVHGDLGVKDSVYGPLDRVRLRSLPPQGWVLGHIHAPRLISEPGEPWMLYPGSPQALDFGETGIHGAWIADVVDHLGTPVQRALSSVRYANIAVDLSAANDEAAAEAAILHQLRKAATSMVRESSPHVQCISVRLTLSGRTPVSHRVGDITATLVEDLSLVVDGAVVDIDRIRVATLPDVDVREYALANSAPGAVARLLLALDQPEPSKDVAALVARVKREIEQIEDHKYFAPLERREISNAVAREYLRDTSRSLLTQLVAQAK